MKNIIPLVVLIIICLSFCTRNQDNNQYALLPTGKKIVFTVPKDCKSTTGCLQYYTEPDGKAYLAYLNRDMNKILFFSMNTFELSFEIEMPQRGPNGVGRITGFVVHNFDTILLTTGQMNVLYLIDSSGVVNNKFPAANIMNGAHNIYFNSVTSTYRNLIIKNDTLYIGTHLLTFPGPKEIQQLKICIRIDMKNNKQQLLPLSYPPLGNNNNEPVYRAFNTLLVKNKFIYSFHSSHNLYITTNFKAFQMILAKSRFIKNDFKLPDLQSGYHSIIKSNLEHPVYRTFLYDPYKNVYYRFVYPGVRTNNSIMSLSIPELMNKNLFVQIFSIMILDSNLKIIGETLMPENTYNMYMAFVNKKGLYISTNHAKNPEFTADSLKFELFKLDKIRNKDY